MSVQFGQWNFDGQPVAPEYVNRVSATLAPYGPDSEEHYSKDGVSILYRAFHTTKESHLEILPHISPSGAVITWDGRLDNRKELISELRNSLMADHTDVALVAAAYERWDENCFGKLLGDWALSLWNPKERSLLLAKDPIGTRHLYYWIGSEQITWSTILDPIVRFAGKNFDLDKEYVAGWLSSVMYPAVHLTPCVGIYSVPPSSHVLLRPGKHTVSKYWDFDPDKRIRYRLDAEYEEHFRTVFAKAVQRKLRSDRPVLAELSGGRDSSSIVCVADMVSARGQSECPSLDTVSYYDDSEPSWNERPYFAKVEEKRGRVGWHINVSLEQLQKDEKAERGSSPQTPNKEFVPTPGYDGRTSPKFKECLAARGNRVVLSGIGGDEVMGGVPNPVAELQDLLVRARFRRLAHQLKVWALEMRKPWFFFFWQAASDFLPPSLLRMSVYQRPLPWLQPKFVKRYRAALTGYPSRTKVFGPLPSFQASVGTLQHLQKQLARIALPFEPTFEKRYPYLDRDLLEFMYAIPREQLVRPTQRRSLMRRALAGIVPDEILNRKAKAFISRRLMAGVPKDDWSELTATTMHMFSVSLGLVDPDRYLETLQKARRGEEVPMLHLRRTMSIEGWLADVVALGCIRIDASVKPQATLQESVQS